MNAMGDGSGRRAFSDEDGATTPSWVNLLSRQDLRRIDEVARRWASAHLSATRVRALTEAALTDAAASFEDVDESDFVVHALPVLRRHLRQAERTFGPPTGRGTHKPGGSA
jgi:hypothetical protein